MKYDSTIYYNYKSYIHSKFHITYIYYCKLSWYLYNKKMHFMLDEFMKNEYWIILTEYIY